MELSNYRLYDNTRISEARRCMRFYFFRHVMHWRLSGVSATALAFGGGWHAAMDVLWKGVAEGGKRGDVIEAAHGGFVKYWTENGMPHPDEIDLELQKELSPRTPMRAWDMLEGYYDKRWKTIREVEVVEIERPFAVPLHHQDPTLFYVGRIDKIIAPSKGRKRGIEHKTTTAMRLTGRGEQRIAGNYLESYSPNSQVDGYAYALRLLYPDDRADVWVDASLVHKTGEDFQFIPVERQMAQLNSWLSDTHWWIRTIEREMDVMHEHDSPSQPFMEAFPKNTNSCFDFNRACPFIDLCKARANPLSYGGVPSGYEVHKWDPLDHIGKPKELVE